ncbi:MAG TPA: SDR family NAD(P)-dependent oxidoreductase [Thermoanaerobaculia bacterium]|nr:SDR family NAD(P)-dependent oxidoreductase [Thermoanaerobaculia bacterium]
MTTQTLAGRVALVTGGSRGIGRAACLKLAAVGAAVAVNYHSRPDAAGEVVSAIDSGGGRALAVEGDVADRAAVVHLVDRVARDLGPIDVLINNAGLLFSGSLFHYDDAELDAMWRTNVKGILHATAAVAPSMIERGWGRVVNVASAAGVGTSLPGTTLYAATKGAVLILTKRLAFELGRQGITVNAVLPGYTRTDMTMAGRSADEARSIVEMLDSRSMIGRGVADPDEIATVIAFLASPESAFMTGQLLLADGGRMDYLAHV